MIRARRLVAGAGLLCGVLLAFGCASTGLGHDPRLVERLDALLLSHADEGVHVSARVIDLSTGRELYARAIDEPVIPASNMKLPFSAAGLDTFGPDATFKTYLAHDGNDLWLIGTGDPAIGDARIAAQYDRGTVSVLEDWAAALRERGLTRISGDLVYYDGAFESQRVHPSWQHGDLVHWYAAPVGGLNFNDNCIDVTVLPTAEGDPARYEVTPSVTNITVVNKCQTGSQSRPRIERMPYSDTYVLGGECAKRTALASKPVSDPGAFFADALRTHLESAGISIDGETRAEAEPLGGAIPPAAEHVVAVHESRMTDVLWRINKSSQNLFAECIGKLAGQAHDAKHGGAEPGSWESAERAVRAFLRRQGINDSRLEVADCSGLSRQNRVTVRIISDLLAAMHRHEHGEAFRASLAAPGHTGTLNARMTDLEGRVMAKTGYIRGVRALSGYVQTDEGKWLCFSIIFNKIPGSVKPFNDLQDDACRILATWPKLNTAAESATGELAAIH